MPGQVESRLRREQVLARVEQVGVERAASEAGVTVRTVDRWQGKARASESVDAAEQVDGELVVPAAPVVSSDPVGEEDDGDLEAQLRRTAQAARRAAESAIRRLEEALPTARNVQAISISIGVLTDKAQMLERLLEEAEERKARLAQGQAEVIASLFPLALEAAGVPVGPFRAVLGELLRRASEGEPLVVSPAVAQPAYAAVRGYFERILREELEAERRMLAAGSLSDDEQDEAEARRLSDALLAGGEGVVGADVPVADVEVAEAELVPDPEPEPVYADTVPGEFLAGYGDERRARAAWEDYKRRGREREEREAKRADSFGVGRHAPRVIA